MKKRILSYLDRIDKTLSGEIPVEDRESLLKEHLTQIGFFQHERLIHLIVTCLFALMAIMTVLTIVITHYVPLFLVLILLFGLLIPYVKHYFLMENGVQKMYEQYDEILKRANEKSE